MSDVKLWKVVDADGGTGVMRTHEDEFAVEPASVADLVSALLAEGGEKVWLCREDDRMQDWAEGSPPHCWFMAESGHHPECGWHLVVPLEDE